MTNSYLLVKENLENLNGLRLRCNLSISNPLIKLDLHNKDLYDFECCYYFDEDVVEGKMLALHLKNTISNCSYLFKIPICKLDFHDLDNSITIIYNNDIYSNYIRIYFL